MIHPAIFKLCKLQIDRWKEPDCFNTMGNKIDPKCKEIYDEYKKCFEDWKKETDMKQWYHEGDSQECKAILDDFHFCCKEQMSRMTNAKVPDKVLQARESVLNDRQQNNTNSSQSNQSEINNSAKDTQSTTQNQ